MGNLRELMAAGFVIYTEKEKFVVKKTDVPEFPKIIGPEFFDDYDRAVQRADDLLLEQRGEKIKEFTVIARYARGLGVEYKNLKNVFARNIQEAKAMADIEVETLFPQGVDEIRVRPA